MAIDIVVYTSIEIDALKEKLDVLLETYKGLFDGPYLLYSPRPVLTREQLEEIDDRVEKYFQESELLIAEEFGMNNAKSYFSARYNDKWFALVNTRELADFFREKLGKDNIIVLRNGEIPI